MVLQPVESLCLFRDKGGEQFFVGLAAGATAQILKQAGWRIRDLLPLLEFGAGKGDEDRIRAAGAEAYVSKPISVIKFIESVGAFV